MSQSMEEAIEAACKARDIAGCVLFAEDISGSFHYEKSIGARSLKNPEGNEPIGPDDMLWIASCTKLMTSIAALQCVENGKLQLDEDVTPILPELKNIDILKGFDDEGKPITVKATKTITLRLLLTHSSGMSYDIFNPILQKWRASQGHVMGTGATVMERHNCPLLYEPGTSWEYSPAVDWAGKMVERVNDNITLEDYMRTHIWEPLGIKDMTFFFKKRPDLRKRMVDCSLRDPSSGKAVYMPDPKWYDGHLVDAMGGGGCFATPREYFKVIKAVLHNDGTLLKQETMDELFKPQLGEASRKTLQGFMDNPDMTGLQGGLPLGTKVDWSLTGCLVLDDIPGWRRKYALNWGGMPNLHWVVDRKAGLCLLYSSQILPPGDAKSVEMMLKFEHNVYERFADSKSRI